jgi:protein TonB
MFQEVVSSPHAHRRWYTVPLSFLVHTIVVAILIVVPLVAIDLPLMPRTGLQFIDSSVMPVVPSPPPALPRNAAAPAVAQTATATPLTAPDGVGAETGVVFQPGAIDTQTLDGIIGGLAAAQGSIVEAAPPVRVAPDAPVRPGTGIRLPARTKYVPPEYPDIARASRVEGLVIIEAIIGVDGRVRNARVLRSHPLLDAAALAAVRAWEYTPTLLNGKPTAVLMTVTVVFDLK